MMIWSRNYKNIMKQGKVQELRGVKGIVFGTLYFLIHCHQVLNQEKGEYSQILHVRN